MGAIASMVPGGQFLSIAFSALSALGQMSQSNAEADIQEQNAAAIDQSAADQSALNEEQARLAEKDRRRKIEAQKADFAGRGILVSEGGPLDVLEESFFNLTRDVQNIRLQGELDSRSLRQRAGITRQEAAQTRSAGTIGAGTSLLGSAFKAFGGSGTASQGGSSGLRTSTGLRKPSTFKTGPSFPF